MTAKSPVAVAGATYPVLHRDRKGNTVDYWSWEEATQDHAAIVYPDIASELTIAPVVETEAESLARRLTGIPQLPLENDRSKVLGDEDYQIVMQYPANQRAREMELAIDRMQDARRIANIVISATNRDRALTFDYRVNRDLAKIVKRDEMAAWLLSPEKMSSTVLAEVKADGLFVAGCHAHVIMEIIRRVIGGVSLTNRKMASALHVELQTMRQGTMPTHVYTTLFKHACLKCRGSGIVLTESAVVDLYIFGLNVQMFEHFIREHNDDPSGARAGAPTTLADAVNAAKVFQDSAVSVNPALSKYLDGGHKGFVAYSVGDKEAGDEDADSTHASTRLVSSASGSYSTASTVSSLSTVSPSPGEAKDKVACQLCGKMNHPASKCFKLGDPDFIKRIGEGLADIPGFKDRSDRAGRQKSKGAKASAPTPPSEVSSVSAAETPVAFEPVVGTSYVVESVSDVSGARSANLEHDDHADVSVLNEGALWLFESLTDCDDDVIGVVPGIVAKVSQRGMLKFDLGKAVVIRGAAKLLISAREVRKSYDWSSVGGLGILYVHKVSKATIEFRLDPVRFKDEFFHAVLEDEPESVSSLHFFKEDPDLGAPSCTAWKESVSSLDFYNPPPLIPVAVRDEARVWPLIRAVERLHWSTNHMSIADMTNLCSRPGYFGDVTGEAVALFAAHRGCSSCRMGHMTAHSQYPSSRGLSTVVGDTVQGDIFFIESDGPKVPVLLLSCEASLFSYIHVFEEAAARAQGPRVMVKSSEIEAALSGALSVWRGAGHSLRSLRFDREGAIASAHTQDWLREQGVSLDLTAAGQKLGLGEVMGRVVKSRCRASVAGIREKYGYKFPLKFFSRLVADTVKVLNRTARQGRDASPFQMFFGVASGLDVRRDLRAPIGEVVLFKTPKRGVATNISDMRSEWGIVISRSFNGTGVIEAYLIESKSYGHRLKFERGAVPSYIMQLLRDLVLQPGPIAHEQVDVDRGTVTLDDGQGVLDRFGSAPVAEHAPPTAVTEPDLGPLPIVEGDGDDTTIGPVLNVLSAQISFRKALLTSPKRATAAMEEEIKTLFGVKRLGRPIHLADIPLSQRKFILRSLDGYKEKFTPTGEFVKSKARVFADGSKQLPEFTAESSSPVARIESVFALAGIAAFRKWEVVRFDVVCGYPNAARPPEVQYRYLRLTPPVSAIVVKLFPDYAAYLDSRGSLIVDLDFLLYGMKEAGFYFYLLMLEMFLGEGLVVNPVDPCVLHWYHPSGWEAHNALTVDDCLFIVSEPAARDAVMNMFVARFGTSGFTFAEGNRIDLLGMLFDFDRVKNRVLISQRKHVADLLAKAGVTRFAKSPCPADLFDVPASSTPCSDPDLYRSLNQSFAFAASRTYPECLPMSSVAASRFSVATESDYARLLRGISYLGHDPDHCLVIHPGSLSLVCSADASYGVHADGKSHSGVCVGFQGCGEVPDSYFVFSSGKQSIVTTSSCEAELVCANKGASYLVWAAQLLEGFRLVGPAAVLHRNESKSEYAHEVLELPILHQDNGSTIHMVSKGRGNFQNSKHIRVRYYYIRDLVLGGELRVIWKSTVDMVSDLLTKGAALGVFLYLLPKLIGKR